MTGIDPRNPPGWIQQLLRRAAAAKGESFHAKVEPAEDVGGSPAIALGVGTFVAPLPVGWSLHPGRPYEGYLRIKEGYDIYYRIDSH